MRTIYLLTAEIDYEGSDVIGAFESESEALDLAARGNAHNENLPECPEIKAPDKAWTAYDRKYKSWHKNHPIKGGSQNAHFEVSPISLKPLGQTSLP